MGKKRFLINDISDDLIHISDKYLKTVMGNSKKDFCKKKNRNKKYGIVFLDLEKYEDNLLFEDPRLDDVFRQYIVVCGISIPVYNSDLYDSLLRLTEIQRSVLLLNEVLRIPLKGIANKFNLSESMIGKHKKKAIERLKRMMGKDETL